MNSKQIREVIRETIIQYGLSLPRTEKDIFFHDLDRTKQFESYSSKIWPAVVEKLRAKGISLGERFLKSIEKEKKLKLDKNFLLSLQKKLQLYSPESDKNTWDYLEKDINIYEYPEEFYCDAGSVTIGDLHGNAVKFVHFLLRHNVIRFKADVNLTEAYKDFVKMYEDFAELIEFIENKQRDIKWEQDKIDLQKERIAKHQELVLLGVLSEKDEKKLIELSENITKFPKWLKDAELEKQRHLVDLNKGLLERKSFFAFLCQFNEFMGHLEIANRDSLVRLIGDELADRGSCDYFTLCLLDFLRENQVKVITLVSNHSNEFITAYERLITEDNFSPLQHVNDYQKPSFLGLKHLIEQEISNEEIKNLVNQSYKPTLKLIDYTLNQDGIRLFTHAPIKFNFIKVLANNFEVVYKMDTKEELARTLDQINMKFQQIVDRNEVHQFFNTDINSIEDIKNMTDEEIEKWPLIYLTWNRWSDAKDTLEDIPDRVNGYNVTYVHGHDDYQSKLFHVINLDTYVGKEKREKEAIRKQEALAAKPEDKVAKNFLNNCKEKIIYSKEKDLNSKVDMEYTVEEFKNVKFKYRILLMEYLEDQLQRLPQDSKKFVKLQQSWLKIAHEELLGLGELVDEIENIKNIVKKHRDKGVYGFFKATWAHKPKSYNELIDLLEKNDDKKLFSSIK